MPIVEKSKMINITGEQNGGINVYILMPIYRYNTVGATISMSR
jgi:hypothetical protein